MREQPREPHEAQLNRVAVTVVCVCVFQVAVSAHAQTLRDRLSDRIRQRIAERTVDDKSESPGTALRPKSAPIVNSDKSTQPIFEDGAKCLFIGHSFFIPVARSFDKIAAQNDFSSHQSEIVFSPGLGGSPRGLWENEKRREQIKAKLASGTVDLFGMSAAGPSERAVEDYRKWIDVALAYNPKTRFFIGQCWVPGGPRMDVVKYAKANEAGAQRNFEIVSRLRKAYPNNHIYFVNYGKVASEMNSQFDAGKLPDIEQLVGRGNTSLFRDGAIGHGGALMSELSALIWLTTLYGADVERVKRTSFSAEAKEIAVRVVSYNEQFN